MAPREDVIGPRRRFAATGLVGSITCAIAGASIFGFGLSLTTTLIAVRLAERGFSARAIGFNAAAAGFATLLTAGFVPRLASYLGVSRLLSLALFLCVLCLLGMAATENYWGWFAIRAVFGAGLTALFVMSEYWINAIAPPHRRGAILGMYAACIAIGFAAGPMILAIAGTKSRAGFLIVMALFLGAALPIAIGSSAAPALGQSSSVPVLRFLLVAPVATLAGMLNGAIEISSMGLLPVYALHSGLSAKAGTSFVALVALGNVVFQFPIGYIADLVERGKLLLLIALFGFLGALLLPAASVAGPIFFSALLLAWGGLIGSFYAVALGYLGARYAGAELAGANAAFIMLYSAGTLLGPPFVGVGMDAVGPAGFFFSIAVLLAAYLMIVLLTKRNQSSRQVS